MVPLTSFTEPETLPDGEKQNSWFAIDESRPISFMAGVWVPQWKSVRKVKEGETVNDLYAFLTTDPNKEVGAIHPKAMPVTSRSPRNGKHGLALTGTKQVNSKNRYPMER